MNESWFGNEIDNLIKKNSLYKSFLISGKGTDKLEIMKSLQ